MAKKPNKTPKKPAPKIEGRLQSIPKDASFERNTSVDKDGNILARFTTMPDKTAEIKYVFSVYINFPDAKNTPEQTKLWAARSIIVEIQRKFRDAVKDGAEDAFNADKYATFDVANYESRKSDPEAAAKKAEKSKANAAAFVAAMSPAERAAFLASLG